MFLKAIRAEAGRQEVVRMLDRNKRKRGLRKPEETKQDFISLALCKCLYLFNIKCCHLHANMHFVQTEKDRDKMTCIITHN